MSEMMDGDEIHKVQPTTPSCWALPSSAHKNTTQLSPSAGMAWTKVDEIQSWQGLGLPVGRNSELCSLRKELAKNMLSTHSFMYHFTNTCLMSTMKKGLPYRLGKHKET